MTTYADLLTELEDAIAEVRARRIRQALEHAHAALAYISSVATPTPEGEASSHFHPLLEHVHEGVPVLHYHLADGTAIAGPEPD